MRCGVRDCHARPPPLEPPLVGFALRHKWRQPPTGTACGCISRHDGAPRLAASPSADAMFLSVTCARRAPRRDLLRLLLAPLFTLRLLLVHPLHERLGPVAHTPRERVLARLDRLHSGADLGGFRLEEMLAERLHTLLPAPLKFGDAVAHRRLQEVALGAKDLECSRGGSGAKRADRPSRVRNCCRLGAAASATVTSTSLGRFAAAACGPPALSWPIPSLLGFSSCAWMPCAHPRCANVAGSAHPGGAGDFSRSIATASVPAAGFACTDAILSACLFSCASASFARRAAVPRRRHALHSASCCTPWTEKPAAPASRGSSTAPAPCGSRSLAPSSSTPSGASLFIEKDRVPADDQVALLEAGACALRAEQVLHEKVALAPALCWQREEARLRHLHAVRPQASARPRRRLHLAEVGVNQVVRNVRQLELAVVGFGVLCLRDDLGRAVGADATECGHCAHGRCGERRRNPLVVDHASGEELFAARAPAAPDAHRRLRAAAERGARRAEQNAIRYEEPQLAAVAKEVGVVPPVAVVPRRQRRRLGRISLERTLQQEAHLRRRGPRNVID
eukprot:4672695-Prymnesium_polylepis.3